MFSLMRVSTRRYAKHPDRINIYIEGLNVPRLEANLKWQGWQRRAKNFRCTDDEDFHRIANGFIIR